MGKPGLADVVLAPLTLLERSSGLLKRSRGRKRRGLVLLYLTIALTVGLVGWREVSLWRLPNAAEPFDLARYGRVEVPDADNAMVAYREVFARFPGLGAWHIKGDSTKARSTTYWAEADPDVRRWAEEQRAALEAWLPANDRPDSLLVQPEELSIETRLAEVQTLRPYSHLALLEGSRLEQSGDLAGAWRIYRATLRASRHAGRHGGSIQRMIGNSILTQSVPRIEAWIDRPGMTPELLRRAIGDVEACRAMTSPASEAVRAEYFMARALVNDTDGWANLADSGPYSRTNWLNQFSAGRWARRFLRRDPERSARVLRLIAAGYLAQCDRPPALRPKLEFPNWMIYDHDKFTPQSVRAISPEALESWTRDSILNEIGPFSNLLQSHLDTEASLFGNLSLKMAERAFAIERGRPPKTYGELLGPYLKALPDGIEPLDLVDPASG
jgi:hypothetical protein